MCTAVTFIPPGGILYLVHISIYGSQLVSPHNYDYNVSYAITLHMKSPSPPLVYPSNKIRTPTSEGFNEAQKEKQRRTIEWTCLVYPRHIASYHRGLCANGASAAASCFAFNASNPLTTSPSTGIWYVLDMLSLRFLEIFSTLLAAASQSRAEMAND